MSVRPSVGGMKVPVTNTLREKKKDSKVLIVDQAHLNSDDSAIEMTAAKMENLGVFKGDTVLVTNKKKKKSTVRVV